MQLRRIHESLPAHLRDSRIALEPGADPDSKRHRRGAGAGLRRVFLAGCRLEQSIRWDCIERNETPLGSSPATARAASRAGPWRHRLVVLQRDRLLTARVGTARALRAPAPLDSKERRERARAR